MPVQPPCPVSAVPCPCARPPGAHPMAQGPLCRVPRQVGIQVSYEDLSSGKHCSICKAYATFVAQGPPGTKVSAAQRAPEPGQRGSHPGTGTGHRAPTHPIHHPCPGEAEAAGPADGGGEDRAQHRRRAPPHAAGPQGHPQGPPHPQPPRHRYRASPPRGGAEGIGVLGVGAAVALSPPGVLP